jgi:hypothetical protein
MVLQVGSIKLSDWRLVWGKTDCWARDILIGGVFHTGRAVVLSKIGGILSGNWEVIFNWELKSYNDIFPNRNLVGTDDEVKKQVDGFMIRMSKLTAFL